MFVSNPVIEHHGRIGNWLHEGALAPVTFEYMEYLRRNSYSERVFADYTRSVAHFAHWLALGHFRISDINEDLVDRFLKRHLRACHCAKDCRRRAKEHRHALNRLLQMLRGQGYIPAIAADNEALATELANFDTYLIEVCGLMPHTRRGYLWRVRDFLSDRFGRREINFRSLLARDVTCFIDRRCAGQQPCSIKAMGVALNSYFRFKSLSGESVGALSAAIPVVAGWSLANLPQTLTDSEIKRLLNAFDRTRPSGRRDYARVRCLSDLGLRAIEVARLQLDDLDWRSGTVRVRGKSRRIDTLPLPTAVGEAIGDYLRAGRPLCNSRAVFVRLRPPREKPIQTSTVSSALWHAACRCGLQHRLKGARMLRHGFATQLVQRGVSLKVIADLLRHRSLQTTAIYAKVDLPRLTAVALSWPGRRP